MCFYRMFFIVHCGGGIDDLKCVHVLDMVFKEVSLFSVSRAPYRFFMQPCHESVQQVLPPCVQRWGRPWHMSS